MQELVELLKAKKLTLCSCESFTGGLFAAEMTSIPSVSTIFKGAVVTYWTEVKEEIVKVDKTVIERYGVISAECAKEMAIKTQRLMHCDCAISFTGNAGPATMENKPAGLVYCAIAIGEDVEVFCDQIKASRNEVRHIAVEKNCERFKEILRKESTIFKNLSIRE